VLVKRQAFAASSPARINDSSATAPRHRRLLALWLVVASAAPSYLAFAQDKGAPAQPPPPAQTTGGATAAAASTGLNWILQDQTPVGNTERLRLGLDQFRRAQYEEAVVTLQLVDPERLGPNDRQMLNDTLRRAQSAADERRAARAEF
jgi:hypothetical protein